MHDLGRLARCPRHILPTASRMVLEHRRCSGAGIGDRDDLGIDHSGRDTGDRATRLDVRMTVRAVAAASSTLWKLYSQSLGKFCPPLQYLGASIADLSG